MKKIVAIGICVLSLSACSTKEEDSTVEINDETGTVNEPSLGGKPTTNRVLKEVKTIDPNNFQADPIKVVQTVFDAAKNQDYSKLSLLRDPMKENDEPTTHICNVESADAQRQAEFIEYFSKGKIIGEAMISNGTAEVNIKFGPEGKMDETFILVNRLGYWYLGQI